MKLNGNKVCGVEFNVPRKNLFWKNHIKIEKVKSKQTTIDSVTVPEKKFRKV